MGEEFETVDIPADMLEDADEWRHQLVDVVSQHDENVLEKYVGEEEITAEDLRKRPAPRHDRGRHRADPVRHRIQEQGRAAAARRGRRLPAEPARRHRRSTAPTSRASEEIVRNADDYEPFSALAFKIMSDPYVGKLTYFRVYSGSLDDRLRRCSTRRRTGRSASAASCRCTPNHREDKDAVFAGDIVAAVGLKNTTTGDTLCDPAHPIVLERMEFPEPVISRRDRAEDQGRPGQARQGARRAVRGGPDLPGPHRRRDRPDDHRAAWASCTSRCSSTA